MGQYLGLVPLGSLLKGTIVTRDGSDTPKDSVPAPTYRVYGPAGLMNNGTGSLLPKDPSSPGGTITGATDAAPIVVTAPGHGLTSGTRVTLAGVTGNGAANGDWNATVLNGDTFSLDGSSGNGLYAGGGVWHVAGLYDFALTPVGGDGYVAGQNYTVLVTWTIAGTTRADTYTFTVV